MIVPLVARNRVLVTLSITVLGSTGRPPLTRDDLAFAMEVATHAAVALDTAAGSAFRSITLPSATNWRRGGFLNFQDF